MHKYNSCVIRRFAALSVLFVLFWAARAPALPSLVGFSGAPGTGGSCAVHCHGSPGGSILVTGFPAQWVPGDTYPVLIGHHSGDAISNFNASVRKANDTPCVGVFVPGPNLELYTSGTDSNALHFATADQDTGSFLWIAPLAGPDSVELYLSGMQSTVMTGLSTLLRLIAVRTTGGIEADPFDTKASVQFEVLNRVVTDYLALRWQTPRSMPVRIEIIGPAGRRLATLDGGTSEGRQSLVWQPLDRYGSPLTPDSYFAVLTAGTARLTRKFAVVR
jgi:hypothetical protein